MINCREDKSQSQTIFMQALQGVEEGAQRGLTVLYYIIVLIVQAHHDELPDVGGEEVVVVPKIEPLGVPLSVIQHQPVGMYSRGSSVRLVFCTRLRQLT